MNIILIDKCSLNHFLYVPLRDAFDIQRCVAAKLAQKSMWPLPVLQSLLMMSSIVFSALLRPKGFASPICTKNSPLRTLGINDGNLSISFKNGIKYLA